MEFNFPYFLFSCNIIVFIMERNILLKKPSSKILKRLILFGIVLLIIIYPLMMYFFTSSNFPVSFIESQLSFNGELLKTYYSTTDINLYRIGQLLDYGFMISYGLLLFSGTLLITRKFERKSKCQMIGLIVATLGIAAALFDALENVFILLMLMNPSGFPNIFAIIHSIMALTKFISFIIILGYMIIAGIALIIKK